MSDAKGQDRNTRISLSKPSSGRLELKNVDSGMVRQSFSHGRSKPVTVEVKRTRTHSRPIGAAPGTAERQGTPETATAASTTAPTTAPVTPTPLRTEAPLRAGPDVPRPQQSALRRPVILKPLTEEEKNSRLRALSNARVAEGESRKKAEEDAKRRAEDEARKRIEDEAAGKRKAEEELRRRSDEEMRRKAEEQATRLMADDERRLKDQGGTVPASRPSGTGAEEQADSERRSDAPKKGVSLKPANESEADDDRARRTAGAGAGKVRAKPARAPGRAIASRRSEPKLASRVVIDNNEVDVLERRSRSLAALRRSRERDRRQMHAAPEQVTRDVVLPESITVQELAARMAVRGAEVIKILMRNGIMATINQVIDADTAELVVSEFGHRVKRVAESDVEEGLGGVVADDADTMKPRAPVVTVMGHVDHGKTSLLDALRKTDVAAREAGGITQHIGAYQVDIGSGTPVTFIDTPGHAAFTAMRARGAAVTDIVVLVVAADDGVMPQTVEAIRHAKAAGVPIIVAINKMDKPDASPERVKNELLSHDLVVEDFGGDVLSVPVSAIKRENLDKLIETIQLQAELLDLQANPDRPAEGAVIEARLDRGRGVVATILVRRGTLRVGDILVCGSQWGRVRALVDDRGRNVESAGPSVPVEVVGLDGVPEAGDVVVAAANERQAREIAEYRQRKKRDVGHAANAGRSMEDLFSQLKAAGEGELPVVVKTDVHGSLEAVIAGMANLKTDEVSVRVLFGGVGPIIESDVTLALASKGMILGFNVRANNQARDVAKRDGVEIRYYSIIYELLDDMKQMLSGMLKPESREVVLGHAEIREVFSIQKAGKIAGCRVVDGLLRRSAKARLLRENMVVFDGVLGSLKRFKDDVREVKDGFECGTSIEGYADIRVGDVIEAYEVEEVARTL